MSVLQQDRDLITSFAESVGIKKLDREIEDLILSDLESKLLEIVQESKKIMRHSMRDVLRVDDVKQAMDKLTIPVRLGLSYCRAYSATLLLSLIHTSEWQTSQAFGI